MNKKKFSDIIGGIVIAGFIASFIVHFPQWVNIVLLGDTISVPPELCNDIFFLIN